MWASEEVPVSSTEGAASTREEFMDPTEEFISGPVSGVPAYSGASTGTPTARRNGEKGGTAAGNPAVVDGRAAAALSTLLRAGPPQRAADWPVLAR
ncbi:hypothetical protein GCM10010261_45430 [Streptomyces pilosus]|uniref:Uncharacterized protein n=1 Tax=Streptomyces pilosus TaxID=28893 RepID=A0A918BJK5_9ACTN|nr:hypothetical protein GCM10010280_20200 [Streptomyces pilosus]GGV58722.1 hypothetical protein GCM10010261_45430 [Streptomyces pilosus]